VSPGQDANEQPLHNDFLADNDPGQFAAQILVGFPQLINRRTSPCESGEPDETGWALEREDLPALDQS